jgi:undecaprenol kinase
MKMPFYKSIGCALRGFWIAFKSERNLKIQLPAALVAIGVGIYLGLTTVEWGLVIFAIGFVFTTELFNTAIEKTCDETCGGKISGGIRNCKDIAAAGVLVSAVAAIIIGIIVLIIPFFQRVF